MKRRSFLGLLGLLPVAIKAVVAKPVEPKPAKENLGYWMSDGTGYATQLRFTTKPLTWDDLNEIYQKEICKQVARTNSYADLFSHQKFKP